MLILGIKRLENGAGQSCRLLADRSHLLPSLYFAAVGQPEPAGISSLPAIPRSRRDLPVLLVQISCSSMIVKLILGLLWCLVHLVINLFASWSHLRNNVECYLISLKLLPKYRNLHLERLAYLGVVVDSREAKNALKVKQLLHWFSTIGIKYLILYDIEGVLKELIQPGTEASADGSPRNSFDVVEDTKAACHRHGGMFMECLSGSDGKEAIAKAANLLHSTCCNSDNKSEIVFTEADMTRALKLVGIGGPEPDLLLVYGPGRCHLGFPAWRLRYTEIMYMGPLESMKYGTIVKALYQFSHKYQNYGK